MKKNIVFVLCFFVLQSVLFAQQFPVYTRQLNNGLQVIVCEKPGNDFAEVQVWYRTGSKDERAGIRGMAHMFEHMMFRGTKKYPGNFFEEVNRKFGWQSNAYTTFDQTVYHEYVPLSSLDTAFDIEADRMANLVITQDILNTERQVVGEEYRNGMNNWYQKMQKELYPFLYPKGHPYEVDVIGNLDEITSFTTKQCMDFYQSYYSPNNAFVVVVGNVKANDIFAKAEKYFSPITKQLVIPEKANIPDIQNHHVQKEEFEIEMPLQIYALSVPSPAAADEDFLAFEMLTEILFTDPNSILINRLVKKEFLAYGIQQNNAFLNLYPTKMNISIVMPMQMGNNKVKKIIRDEISNIIENGIDAERMQSYIKSNEASQLLSFYQAGEIASQLGSSQYYYKDCQRAFSLTDLYRKINSSDLQRVAAKYYQPDQLQFINMKPQ